MITERQQKILELIVKDYVKNSKPVSSKILTQKKLELSSATLRNEMIELEKAGYLNQPHTSAGRVPTEKAYRFFINLSEKKTEVSTEINQQSTEDIFEQHFNYLFKEVGEETTQVFIGKDIPLIKTKKYSLIVTGHKTPNKKNEIIGFLSPTRMNYDYNISLINKLKEYIEEFYE
jgi:heat-inducible transcriptional repressor